MIVVADDLTGAHDIGIMFAKSGALSMCFHISRDLQKKTSDSGSCLMCLFSTHIPGSTRLMLRNDKTFRAARLLQRLGCRQFYKKTCSVFRGNIGAEFDAMLDALNESFAGIVVGFQRMVAKPSMASTMSTALSWRNRSFAMILDIL